MDTITAFTTPDDFHLLDSIEAGTSLALGGALDEVLEGRILSPAAPQHSLYASCFVAEPGAFRAFVAGKCAWAMRAFGCIVLAARGTDERRLLDAERLWLREDLATPRDDIAGAVDDLIELVQGLDAVLLFQAAADVECLATSRLRPFVPGERDAIERGLFRTYRLRYIEAGLRSHHFNMLLRALLPPEERARLEHELKFIATPPWRNE